MVVCETDYLDAYLLVTQEKFTMSHGLADIVAKIKEVLMWNWTVSVTLIQRTANRAADHMAKNSARHQHAYTEWFQPWTRLQSIILEETSISS
ncbi:hypothetical protein PIB30_019106 [Stylosanthes scabra]|uniref:RNase H type-1 domain-containing protein n=1 Tax=Stylosanthes scabra TaxID=79078 RepID=A0ABU6VB65_9FABA|nr:hypothetical protein [Stylosanthes scabra]